MAYSGLLVNTKGNSDADFMRTLDEIQNSNNRLSERAADRANDFTQMSQRQAMAYNSNEAEINRAFQMSMSNTAHQREVKDLIRAGLNPVLSANNGASVTSGSSASVSGASGIKAEIDMQKAQLYAQNYMNRANNANAVKMNNDQIANAMKMKQIDSATALKQSQMAAAASMYGARQAAGAASYGAYLNYMLGQDRLEYDRTHFTNPWQLLSNIIGPIFEGDTMKPTFNLNDGKGTSSKGNSSAK